MALPRTASNGPRLPDVLIVVEDPGAANFMQLLPDTFRQAGLSCSVVSCGHASEFLRARKVEFESVAADSSPGHVMSTHGASILLAGTSQNPASLALGLIDEFRRMRRPTLGFVDMAVDADLRFKGVSDDPLRHAPDAILAADRATRHAFEQLGYPPVAIHVCGHPAYDGIRRRSREFAGLGLSNLRKEALGADPAPRPVWLFAAEHDGDDPRLRRTHDYSLAGRGLSDRRVDIVLEEVLDARDSLSPRPYFILRLHPKNTREEFSRYLHEVDLVSEGGDALNLICASDVVIGMSSIFLMEAAIAGRRTVSIAPRPSECSWSPSVVEGLTPCESTRAGIRRSLMSNDSPIPRAEEDDAASRVLSVVLERLRKQAAG